MCICEKLSGIGQVCCDFSHMQILCNSFNQSLADLNIHTICLLNRSFHVFTLYSLSKTYVGIFLWLCCLIVVVMYLKLKFGFCNTHHWRSTVTSVVSKKVMWLSALNICVFNKTQVIFEKHIYSKCMVCYVTPNMRTTFSVCHLFNRSTRIHQL